MVSSEGCHRWQNIFSSGENQNKNHGTQSQALRVNWIWDVETETLSKFDLMNGVPVRGESIPVRLFLSPYELTPTYRNINNKFSVKYFLNLVLVDEEDRRYFKQQEITVYRLSENS
ncbi:hypothetical protein JHK87_055430 [Glycine soja]|nr:hypothetical protein JHK87_055430 [Glycine soja]